METNELKNIWKALADNNLVDKDLAKENIHQIITKKSKGLISKMKRKIRFDNVMYLATMILIPLTIIVLNVILKRPSPILQRIGIFTIECYLIYMFIKTRSKIQALNYSHNTGTIKDMLTGFRRKYLHELAKEKIIITLFGYFLVLLALVQYFIYKGSILPIDFTSKSSILPIFLVLMLFLMPLIFKLEYKYRFSGIIKEINSTIDELNSETE